MGCKIECDPSSEIVSVIFSGQVNLGMKLRAVEEVCSNYRDQMPLKIIVDVREVVMMDMLLNEQEAFGEYLANHFDLHYARVAVLHKPSFNPNAVIDVKAYKNGYQLSEFSSQSEAEQWLLEEDPDLESFKLDYRRPVPGGNR